MVTIGTLLVSVVVLLVSTLVLGVPAQSDNGNGNGICGPTYIRNTPSELQRLKGCRVIEGSLQIALIEKDGITPEHYQNYSFPLREITGYFLLYSATKLLTLRHLFPNLTVIRGQEFIHNNYAFLVSESHEMQEIGLPSLTSIKGKVWIYNNQNLCYLDTIDWASITNDTQDNGIKKNRNYEQCPNKCPANCPKNEHGQALCWSNEDCQKVRMRVCPDGDTLTTECCSPLCLGGCTGKEPTDCLVCKDVEYNGKCMTECPAKTYKYLNRRCVTEEECSAMNYSDPSTNKRLLGKMLGDKECVLECPKKYEEFVGENGGLVCRKCEGPCKKTCPGLMVDSVESSGQLKGCTKISGSLKIQIRGYSKDLALELSKNMDMIEEIDEFLVIAYTYSLSSLNFFKALKVINGNKLEENTYALVVKSNDNIVSLWNTTVDVKAKAARVLFHYNPKLCLHKIHNFLRGAGLTIPANTSNDIGYTNGDKVPCNQKKLMVRINKMTNSSVTIAWENFLRNLTEPTHLLNYEVSYKEATGTVSPYDDRDPCGQDDWKVLDVPKMMSVKKEGESVWEDEKLISNLKFFTRYALYVRTVVIPDSASPNNNTGAESDVLYFVTLPDEPSPPYGLSVSSNSSSDIHISWYAPKSPNGELEEFEIYMKSTEEDVQFQDQRDFCIDGRPDKTSNIAEQSTTKSFVEQILPPGQLGPGCCSCDTRRKSSIQNSNIVNQVNLEKDIEYAIVNKVFIPNPDVLIIPEDTSATDQRRRRRRRAVNGEEAVGPDSDEVEFPNETFLQLDNNHPGRKPGPDFNLTQRINVSSVPAYKNKRYELLLRNLTHFRTYTVGVVACRKKSPEIDNDTRLCSEMTMHYVKTKPSPTADIINPNSVSLNVTGQRFRLRWDEPQNPNGVVLAYHIQVKKVDSSKTGDAPILKCISRKDFQEGKNNYTYPTNLPPGNYSYSIRTVSLAAESNFTVEKYFVIEEGGDYWTAGFIVTVIVLPCFIIIISLIIGAVWYLKKSQEDHFRLVTSANPEYMQNVDIPEEWEVPREKLEILQVELVGQGSFGLVFEGLLKDFIAGTPKMRCAVKTVSQDAPSEDRARFLQEALIMTQLHCHHVVRLLGVISKSQPTYVIMELMPRGDLKKYLRSRRPDPEYNGTGEPPPTLTQILKMAAEIADGMAYLDSHRLVHRDLAARNCMVDEDLTVKVGDFGMTKDVFESEYYRKASRGLLPVRWMAPESLRDGMFSSKSDSWSFGVVLWEMATLAAQPYQGLTNDQVLSFVKSGGIMERPEECPASLYDVMVKCWNYETRNRPTFSEILEWVTPSVLVESPKFAQVSFYHSPEGIEYQAMAAQRQAESEEVTLNVNSNARTPLRATCDSDDDLNVTDDFESDEHDHDIVHSPYSIDSEHGTLLTDRTANGGLPRIRCSASGNGSGSGSVTVLPNSINSLSSSGGGGSLHYPASSSLTSSQPQPIQQSRNTNHFGSSFPSQGQQGHSPSSNAFVSLNLGDPLSATTPLLSNTHSSDNNRLGSRPGATAGTGGPSGGGDNSLNNPPGMTKFPQNNSHNNPAELLSLSSAPPAGAPVPVTTTSNHTAKTNFINSLPPTTNSTNNYQYQQPNKQNSSNPSGLLSNSKSHSNYASTNNKNPKTTTTSTTATTTTNPVFTKPTLASAVNNPQNYSSLNDTNSKGGLSIPYPSIGSDSVTSAGTKVSNGVAVAPGGGAPTTVGNNPVSPTGSQGNSGGNGYITLRHSPVTENYPKNKTSQF